MKELVVARNVVNTDEIIAWLGRLSERYSDLSQWIGGPVRKWIGKNAPAEPFTITSTKGLPDWLKKSMDSGNPPENVVLDEALEARLIPVFDYMNDLLATKPDTNLASIGFDVAEARSLKWHADMAKKATKIRPIPEDGAEIVKDYGNGWTWRRLVGKECLINEGEAMGHCVGRFGYYERVIRAKLEIFSLRAPDNSPHVTIEADMKAMTIAQIKGRANAAVVDKYLPMVQSFIAGHTWNAINYDGATSVEQDIKAEQILRNKPVFVHGNMALVKYPSPWSGTLHYEVFVGKDSVGKVLLVTDNRLTLWTPEETAPNVDFLARSIVALDWLDNDSGTLMLTVAQAAGLQFKGWEPLPDNHFGAAIAQMLIGQPATHIHAQKSHGTLQVDAIYSAAKQTTFMHSSNSDSTALKLAMALTEPQKNVVKRSWINDAEHLLVDVSERVKRLQAGKTVKSDMDDEALLNALLVALKQPDVATVKAAYARLKAKPEITDTLMKQVVMPVSGRAINGIGGVLMCTLALKNLDPFRKYVFSKPNLLTCWTEILTKPDHILAGLKTYGLGEDTISAVITLLRNEFLRLVPTEEGLTGLELDLSSKNKVILVMNWARGHRQDAARSKKLWSSV